MKPLVLFATLVVFVSGRPEPPAGYNYPRPGGHHQHQPQFVSPGGISGGNIFGPGPSDFGGSSIGPSVPGANLPYVNGGYLGPNSFVSGSQTFGEFGGSSGHSTSQHHFGGHHSQISGGGLTSVQKHIYVHVPPPEPEEFRPQQHFAVGQAQKHYKIIFIKAPSQATPTAPSIPLQAQSEEKTLVYVLVKKPDEQPEISLPIATPTQPSKPEVYFIRYKTKKDQQHGIGSTGSSGSLLTGSGLDGGSIGGLNTGGISSGGITSGGLAPGGISAGGPDHLIHGGAPSQTLGGPGHNHAGSVSASYGPPGHSAGPY